MNRREGEAAIRKVFQEEGRGSSQAPDPEGHKALVEAGHDVFQYWWNTYGAIAKCKVNFSGLRFENDVTFSQLAISLCESFEGVCFAKEVDFKATEFSRGASFKNARFLGQVKFRKCTFGGDANFGGAVFEDDAHFQGATFKEGFFFDQVKVCSLVDFAAATFSGITTFKAVDFAHSEKWKADSSRADKPRCDFSSVKSLDKFSISDGSLPENTSFVSFSAKNDCVFSVEFRSGATFANAQFWGKACFEHATFPGKTDFQGSSFHSLCCKNLTFCGDVSFAAARFASCSFGSTTWKGRADFTNASFGKKTDFSGADFAKDVDLSWTTHQGESRIADVSFQGAVFHGAAIFSGRRFVGTAKFTSEDHDPAKFCKSPVFHGCSFPEEIDISGATFEDWDPPQSRYNYRVLKRLMSEKHAGWAEAQFFRHELRSEERLRTKGHKWRLLWLYRKTSDYGASITRPAVLLFVTTLSSGLVYALAANLQPGWDWDTTMNLFTFTLAKSLPITGMDRTVRELWNSFAPVCSLGLWKPILMEAAQKILTLLWFFLIGLGLRNRLRLK